MSLPGAAGADAAGAGTAAGFAEALDPFRLWDAPAGSGLAASGLAFGASGDGDTPAAVWAVDADQPGALALRGRLARAQAASLAEAEARLDAFLEAWRGTRGGAPEAGVNFAASEGSLLAAPLAVPLPEAERGLAQSLAQLAGGPGSAASYGLPGGGDLTGLRTRFEDWLERANRHLLHLAWVDTLVGGRLAARTAAAWDGDVFTICARALDPKLLAAHRQSFGLAMTSRVTMLRSVAAVASMAAKITLAVATPLGPLQALLLAAQFLREVVVPAANVLMEEDAQWPKN